MKTSDLAKQAKNCYAPDGWITDLAKGQHEIKSFEPSDELAEILEHCAKVVDGWPEWKRSLDPLR